MVKLSTEQKIAIELGVRERKGLIKAAKRAAKRALSSNGKYHDTIIAGDSGVGKTFNITRELDNLELDYYQMTGNSSIFGFMGNLLYLHSCKPAGQKLVVFLDDCDFLFEPKNINILKNLTATNPSDRKFEYSKKVEPKQFTEAQQNVLDNYLKDGLHGLTIPCDEFIFIISSNFVLPDATQVEGMTNSQKQKYQDFEAIRGRTKAYDLQLSKQEKWGWLYDVGINDGALDMIDSEQDKLYLLDWLWSNWERMKETSVRTIEKMGYEMVEDPEDYKDYWEIDYLK